MGLRRASLLVSVCVTLASVRGQVQQIAQGGGGGLYDPTIYLQGKGAGPTANASEIWRNFVPSPQPMHDEIVRVSPDVFEMLPKEYDPNYRNPCWRTPDNAFRCLPYFHVLGVSKCGTTDIYARLIKHPDVVEGEKGPHWWDACEYSPDGKRERPCYLKGDANFHSYIKAFHKAGGPIRERADGLAITGEASSNTFTATHTYARGIQVDRGMNVSLSRLMHEAQPYLRHIVIFRDPVTRYHSSFYYYRDDPKAPFEPPEEVHARVVHEIKRWKHCVAQRTQAECVRAFSPQQLIKGMYSEFVESWTSVWPKDQFLFIRNEDYKRAQREHLTVIFRFLGLRDLTEEEWPAMLTSDVANSQGSYPDMLPETKALLRRFYKPFNNKLAELMNDPRYTWRDVYQNEARKRMLSKYQLRSEH